MAFARINLFSFHMPAQTKKFDKRLWKDIYTEAHLLDEGKITLTGAWEFNFS